MVDALAVPTAGALLRLGWCLTIGFLHVSLRARFEFFHRL